MSHKNIKFEFNKAVEEALEYFPELRKSTAFYDIKSDEIYKSAEYEEKLKRPLYQGRRMTRSSQVIYARASQMQIMLFNPNEYNPFSLSFEFNHELAHLIYNANKDPYCEKLRLKEETTSDAFATLLNLQGSEDNIADDIERIIIYRTVKELNGGSRDYLTSPVLLEILADSYKSNFKPLSLRQSFNKAVQYVEKYSLSNNDYNAFREKYASCKKIYKAEEMLKLLSSTCLSSNNKNIFITGAQVFLYHTEGGDKKWEDARKKINTQAKELNLSHLLFKDRKPSI